MLSPIPAVVSGAKIRGDLRTSVYGDARSGVSSVDRAGQTIDSVVKDKAISFETREDLEDEIADLIARQGRRCALTGYDFDRPSINPHLKPSHDRNDSGRGYQPGNLLVVTQAANFYKSASDGADWAMKAMVAAMQAKKKAEVEVAPGSLTLSP